MHLRFSRVYPEFRWTGRHVSSVDIDWVSNSVWADLCVHKCSADTKLLIPDLLVEGLTVRFDYWVL